MNKETMIEVFFYIGYSVSTVLLVIIFLVSLYLIFLRCLNFKKLRFFVFRLILRKSIDTLSDDKFNDLINEMQKERNKISSNDK